MIAHTGLEPGPCSNIDVIHELYLELIFFI